MEIQCYDDNDNKQGKAIIVVLAPGGKGRLYECAHVQAEDENYEWWATEGEGHPNPGLYRHAAGKGDDG